MWNDEKAEEFEMLKNKYTIIMQNCLEERDILKVYTELIRTFLNRAFSKIFKVLAASKLR